MNGLVGWKDQKLVLIKNAGLHIGIRRGKGRLSLPLKQSFNFFFCIQLNIIAHVDPGGRADGVLRDVEERKRGGGRGLELQPAERLADHGEQPADDREPYDQRDGLLQQLVRLADRLLAL